MNTMLDATIVAASTYGAAAAVHGAVQGCARMSARSGESSVRRAPRARDRA
jgi:hypothetical protein